MWREWGTQLTSLFLGILIWPKVIITIFSDLVGALNINETMGENYQVLNVSPSFTYFKSLIYLKGKKKVKWKDLVLQRMEEKKKTVTETTLIKEIAN